MTGAGLSGLQAAQIVQGAGFKVCVVEAIDRVGGKTLTAKSCEKGFNDLGASWINDTNQSEMFKLYQRYGIDTEVQRDRGHTLIQSAEGSLVKVPYGELPVFQDECSLLDLDDPTSSVRAREIDQLTFRDFCIEKIQSESAVTIADVLSVSLLGVESYEVSALFMLLYFKSGAGIDNIIPDQKNGGQYLRNRQARKMAEELGPDVVFLRMPVTSIDQSRRGHCVVQTQGGATFESQRVIVSVPSSLYHKIEFNPPLQKKELALSENTTTGYYTKMVYVFHEPWWQKAGFSGVLDSEKGPIIFSRDTSVPVDDQWAITCFIAGDKGRQWSKMPRASQAYFLGAPCPITTPGTLSIVGKEIAAPFGHVHFVGTETSRVWRGYMEGAIQSGQRGGAEVVKAFSTNPTSRL
ncbi:hypothetical protein BDV36DRAFT_306416 [Aspergillus pseudocaelatus]|uniref:monoamine oxidase n=1 Tax=Aspergillus pseudocaelatus TaxID=1825620 RepID=A0ABQ6WWC1_9EURO|nr:hypothetical protein BDV36DRAFT_306416 [Aspergillus pseudocaelatus]